MATKVILSVEEFLSTFVVGDTFWHMWSIFSEPGGIAKATILSFDCHFVIVEEYGNNVKHSIMDFTNRWHGAFTNEEDANAYLEERKVAYATDPALTAEVEREKAFAKELDDELEELYEEEEWLSKQEE